MTKQKNGKRRKWVTYKDVLNAYRDPSGKGIKDVEKMWDSGLIGRPALKRCLSHLQEHGSHKSEADLLAFCQEKAQADSTGVPRPQIGETREYATYSNGAAQTPFARTPLYGFDDFKAGDKVSITFKKNELVVRPSR